VLKTARKFTPYCNFG